MAVPLAVIKLMQQQSVALVVDRAIRPAKSATFSAQHENPQESIAKNIGKQHTKRQGRRRRISRRVRRSLTPPASRWKEDCVKDSSSLPPRHAAHLSSSLSNIAFGEDRPSSSLVLPTSTHLCAFKEDCSLGVKDNLNLPKLHDQSPRQPQRRRSFDDDLDFTPSPIERTTVMHLSKALEIFSRKEVQD